MKSKTLLNMYSINIFFCKKADCHFNYLKQALNEGGGGVRGTCVQSAEMLFEIYNFTHPTHSGSYSCLFVCLCFTSLQQRGHLETAPFLLSLAKDVKLGKYTVPTGNRTPNRHVAVHYATATPRKLPKLFVKGPLGGQTKHLIGRCSLSLTLPPPSQSLDIKFKKVKMFKVKGDVTY